MSSVEDIDRGFKEPRATDPRRFREWWFAAFDEDLWDRQIEGDFSSSRLDALIEEARTEHRSSRTRPL